MKILIVGGTFDDAGGKPSGWITKFSKAVSELEPDTTIYNGGTWETLNQHLSDISNQEVICWFADVPNDKPKIVENIKKNNPKVFLVSSKRNLDNKYSLHDLVSRALNIKANLCVEFTGSRSNVQSTIIDPLGNVFLSKETGLTKVATTLVNRLNTLMSVERIPSFKVGEKIDLPDSEQIQYFLKIIKKQAEVFHEIIHGANTTRMLGNASFRCERGFPSFREGELIYVSQRNIDKRFIGPEAFVATRSGSNGVEYYGDIKPSVDTPVQLLLYEMYPNVHFMLHSHTYIDGASFTKEVLPCGAIEEASQIWHTMPNFSATNFLINIKGHGSICLAESPEFLETVNWTARPSPEFI